MPSGGDTVSGKCPWGAFNLADATPSKPWDTPSAGYYWGEAQVRGGTVWYPACGSRYDNSKLYVVSHSGYAWSTSSQKHYLGMDPGTITPDRNTASGSYGFPVRCIRE